MLQWVDVTAKLRENQKAVQASLEKIVSAQGRFTFLLRSQFHQEEI